MTQQQFGDGGDPTQQQGFNQTDQSDQTTQGETQATITPEELIELQKRDVNAQTHIPQLENENQDLRDKLSELEGKLDSATALDDVLKRLEGNSGEPAGVDQDQLAEQVSQRLQLKSKQEMEDQNWTSVVEHLTKTYGKWEDADLAIQAKCAELKMEPKEASAMAARNPAIFYKLFEQEQPKPAQQGVAVQSTNQQTSHVTTTDQQRAGLEKHYQDMRKSNPNKYWSAETQAQYRRDLHGAV